MAKASRKVKPSSRQAKGAGIFSRMRGGMKAMVGTSSKAKKKMTFWDVLFLIVAVFLATWILVKRCA